VNARSDDLLALKVEDQLESRLNDEGGPEFEVQKSKLHPNCVLVRPVNPEPPPDSPALLNFKMRRKEMAEIEHFLDRDLMHFGNFAPE
jgi:hypothetical protein